MKNIFKALFVAMIISLFIIRPASSYADWSGHDGSGHDGGSHGGSWHGQSGGWHGHSYVGVNLSVWPNSYYYGAAYYPPDDAVLVSAPVYEPVVVNGITYYLSDGTYYAYNGSTYQAIAPPVTVVQQPVTVVQPPAVTAATPGVAQPDSFTINIPNDKGGYTAVTLKKSGNGFIGPQGEFYSAFPTVAQLKVMYGK